LKRFAPYGLALAAVAFMTAVRWLLTGTLGFELPFITLFPAVFFAAWLGGIGPAIAATLAGMLAALYLFFPPMFSFHLFQNAAVGLVLFGTTGIAAGLLGNSRLRALSRAQAAANEASEALRRAEQEAVVAAMERLRAEDESARAGLAASNAAAVLSQHGEAEAAFRESEARFRTIAQSSPLGIYLTDPAGNCVYTNPAYQRISGLTAEQAGGAGWRQALHPEDRERVSSEWYAAAEQQQPFRSEHRFRHADGTVVPTRVNAAEIRNGDALVGYVGLVEDITASKQAEAARQTSEARFRSVYRSNMIGIAFWNGEQITDGNDALLDMLGYTRAEMRQGLLRHGTLTPPGHEEADRRAFEEVKRGGACAPYEKEFWRKGGTVVPVLVGGALLANDINDAVFFVLDLSERKRAEERLRHSERIEVVGQLAGGMAHEANNQMTVILGATDFILRYPGLAESVRQDVEYIRAAAERTTSITRQLLAFSRRQILSPRVVDLNQVVTNLESMLRRTLVEHQGLTLQLSPAIAPIRADPVQLDQILLNLTINARDAMPRGGTLTIETRTAQLTERDVTPDTGVPVVAGPYTALVVTDTGHGMDRETLKHVFEPFFTTKGVGQGSGLGLATVFGIVKQSGGHIVADSKPGVGTTLKLFFPAVERAVQEPEASSGALEPGVPTESRTILLVEDDPLVRSMVERSLGDCGFRVIAASNGAEGLAMALRHGDRVDVVLTDLAMPDMGGRELARRLAEQRPNLPVVFMSGYTDDDVIRRGLLDDGLTFLQKPLSPAVLVRHMREVLDRSSAGEVRPR
jgi:two-component system, cell cycle sensor histidine kinase and response regulator CckA